ncbi:SH3 domain-containing protein [Devosia submarina]|uniref:SH3 domain-containing protein n=1 Tax=Devosia submarina TaxID=1173082 RepID=UPI000D3D2B50|nr:SH3 domain-containing protein [Devosia submarina]
MKSVRLGLVATLSLLASTLGAFAAPATVTAHVNVRSGPGVEYRAVGSVPRNTVVDLGQCRGDWCQISSYGLSGWVSSQYLVDAPLPSPQPQPQPQPPTQPQPNWPQPDWSKPGSGRPHQGPDRPRPPRPTIPAPVPEQQDAGACFYAERNFGGASFCLEQGEELARFRTWDNRIRSVEVFGGAKVDLCSDRNLYGACVTLRRDTGRLPSDIDRRASSVEVY